jgi:hypothetical protein
LASDGTPTQPSGAAAIDLLDDVGIAASSSDLSDIAKLVDQALVLKQEQERIESALKDVNADLRTVLEVKLPELMLRAGIRNFVTESGRKVEVKKFYSATITESNAEAAMRWLEEHGFGALIKNVVSVMFDREQNEAAVELLSSLRDQDYEVMNKQSVHAGTLKSWLREQLEAGKEVPMDLFSAFVGDKATIK